MGFNNLNNLPAKLSAVSYYPALFKAAFGSEEITLEKISKALAQFLRAIVSHNSKYDQGVDQNFANFTPLENLGRNLFSQKLCDHCHGGSNFSMNWSTEGVNIGLDMNYNDNGVGVTQTNTALNGCFKVPSLRNIALSAPYMHDGRFQKLEDVIDFYNSNVQPHANLNFRLREGYNNSFINTIDPPIGIPIDPVFFNFGSSNPRRLNLSSLDKQALVAFLKTLTDYSVTTDPKFSDPFFK
jgi:cytochrome c peroxidase